MAAFVPANKHRPYPIKQLATAFFYRTAGTPPFSIEHLTLPFSVEQKALPSLIEQKAPPLSIEQVAYPFLKAF